LTFFTLLSVMAGKTVIISGASSGIGLAAAVIFAKNGWKTFAGVRTDSKKKDIVEAAKANHVEQLLNPVELDVTKTESVVAAVKHVLSSTGHIDLVVNNAGYGVFGAVETLTEADVLRQYDTNVIGMLRLTQAVLPLFRAQKSGRIVNISSLAGSISFPYAGVYSSSKWALEALSQSLQAEVAQFGISVAVVQPGYTNTGFVQASAPNTGKVKEPIYDQGLAAAMKANEDGVANGTPAKQVAETIFRATTDPVPHFRYQVTEKDTALIGSVLKDPTGLNKGLAGVSK